MIFVWATIYSRTREKSKINFSKIVGKEMGVLNIFRFIFVLIWPFKTLEYTSFIVTFLEKLRIMVFWFRS